MTHEFSSEVKQTIVEAHHRKMWQSIPAHNRDEFGAHLLADYVLRNGPAAVESHLHLTWIDPPIGPPSPPPPTWVPHVIPNEVTLAGKPGDDQPPIAK